MHMVRDGLLQPSKANTTKLIGLTSCWGDSQAAQAPLCSWGGMSTRDRASLGAGQIQGHRPPSTEPSSPGTEAAHRYTLRVPLLPGRDRRSCVQLPQGRQLWHCMARDILCLKERGQPTRQAGCLYQPSFAA